MDRPLLMKVLLVIAFVLLLISSLMLGGVLITGVALSTALAVGVGGLASWVLSVLVGVL